MLRNILWQPNKGFPPDFVPFKKENWVAKLQGIEGTFLPVGTGNTIEKSKQKIQKQNKGIGFPTIIFLLLYRKFLKETKFQIV